MTRNAATSRRSKQTNPATKLATSVVEPLPGRSEQLQPAFSTRALFWRPHHPATSPALGQIPFLFWLTETVRPRTIVQFGIGDGVFYMGVCQACERLGDSTICLGIQAEEPLLSPIMRAQHHARYSDFSELRQGDIRTIAPRFAGQIDLLVLNQTLGSEELARFHSKWMPLLSDRAVILLCDPDKIFSDESTREILFPEKDRSIVFGPVSTGGHAVEVILYGKEQAERLIALASQRPGEHAYLVTRQVFNRLGQGIEAIQKAEDVQKENDSLRASLQAIEKSLEVQRVELGAQRAETKAARDAEAAEVSRQAELVSRLYDVEQLLSEKSRQAALLEADKKNIENRIKTLETQAATWEAEHESALEAAQHNGNEALAALRGELESISTTKSALEVQFGALKKKHEEQSSYWQAEIEVLRKEKAAVETQLSQARTAYEERIEDIALLTEKHEVEAAARRAETEVLRKEKAAVETQLSQARTAYEERIEDIALLTEKYQDDLKKLEDRDQHLKLRVAELSAQLDAATVEARRILADLHKTAGEEIGRVVKALLPAGKSGFLAKKASLLKQAKLLVNGGIMDQDWYLERHTDVAAAGMDPAVHYLLHGAEEGRHLSGRLEEATRPPR